MPTTLPEHYAMRHRVLQLFYSDPRGRYTVEDAAAWLQVSTPSQVSTIQCELSRLTHDGILDYRSVRTGVRGGSKIYGLVDKQRAATVLSSCRPHTRKAATHYPLVSPKQVYDALEKSPGSSAALLVIDNDWERFYIGFRSAQNAVSRRLRSMEQLGMVRHVNAPHGLKAWFTDAPFQESRP